MYVTELYVDSLCEEFKEHSKGRIMTHGGIAGSIYGAGIGAAAGGIAKLRIKMLQKKLQQASTPDDKRRIQDQIDGLKKSSEIGRRALKGAGIGAAAGVIAGGIADKNSYNARRFSDHVIDKIVKNRRS